MQKALEKAIKRYRQGRHDDAASLCRKILKRLPREPNALHLLGVVHLMNDQCEKAAEMLAQAATVDRDNAEIHSNLGSALRACGRYDAAEESFRRAINLRPASAGAHFNLGNALRAQARYDEAIGCFEKALRLDPGHLGARNNLAIIHDERGDLAAACDAYNEVLALDPDHVDARRNLASLMRRRELWAEALENYETVLAAEPADVWSLGGKGLALVELGRAAEALPVFQRAATLDPDNPDSYNNLGNTLGELHRYPEALDCYERVIDLDPDHAEARNNIANVLQVLGRIEESIPYFEEAIELAPSYAEARYGLGMACLRLGQFSKGWYGYRSRPSMRQAPDGLHRKPFDKALEGTRILVSGEQGIGDEIFFLRFAAELRGRGARVIYAGDDRIAPMLSRAAVVDTVVASGDRRDADIAAAVGDLPFLLGHGNEAGGGVPASIGIPALPDRIAEIGDILQGFGPPPYIGVTWRAGTVLGRSTLFKETPLDGIAAALRKTGATVVLMQRNPIDGECAAFTAALDRDALDLTALNTDLEGVLALGGLLDDYVCVSNTNVHLRAAQGKTCRILVPVPPEFRWMASGDESPWFPGTPLYRQAPDGNWTPAFTRLAEDLSGAAP